MTPAAASAIGWLLVVMVAFLVGMGWGASMRRRP
jgi:hypothetical protein